MRSTFESVDYVKQFALPNVGWLHPIRGRPEKNKRLMLFQVREDSRVWGQRERERERDLLEAQFFVGFYFHKYLIFPTAPIIS